MSSKPIGDDGWNLVAGGGAVSRSVAPGVDTTPTGKEEITAVEVPKPTTTQYYMNQLAKGLFGQVGRYAETVQAMNAGEPGAIAIFRSIFGSDLVNKVSPLGDVVARELADSVKVAGVPLTEKGVKSAFTRDMKAPGAISKVIGAGVEAIGSGLAFPGSGVVGSGAKTGREAMAHAWKQSMINAGAGSGGEIGGDIGAGLGGFVADMVNAEDKENWRTVGRVFGSVGGGAAGGYAGGAVKVNAAGEVLGGAGKQASNLSQAVKATFAERKAGDKRALYDIFSDQFGTLNADAKGFLDRYVFEKIADQVLKSPTGRQAYESAKASALAAGIELREFTPAQVIADPVIVEQTRLFPAISDTQRQAILNRQTATGSTLNEAYKAVMGDVAKPTTKNFLAGLEDLRDATRAKLEASEQVIKQTLREIPPAGTSASRLAEGRMVRQELEAIRQPYNTRAQELYSAAENLADTNKVVYEVAGKMPATQAVFKEFQAQVDPSLIPSEVRNLMKSFQGVEGATGVGLRDLNGALKAINNRLKDLRSDMSGAANQQRSTLMQAKTEVQNIINTQGPDEVKNAFGEATRFYSQEYAPRFSEGLGFQLKKPSGSVPGRQMVQDAEVMDKFLPTNTKNSEALMLEADKLFGRNDDLGIRRNTAFYDALDKRIMEKFNATVVEPSLAKKNPADAAKELDAGMAKFLRDHESYFYAEAGGPERLPGTEKKIVQLTQRIQSQKLAQARELNDYKQVVKSPVTEAIGEQGANNLFATAMADKAKMTALVNRLGPDAVLHEVFMRGNPMTDTGIDATKLSALLNSGKRSAEGPSSLLIAFQAKYGPEKGLQHYQRLEGIASLAERIPLGDPKYGRMPANSRGPVEQAVGQSAAGIFTNMAGMGRGNVSPTWIGSAMVGRFLNAKTQQAIQEAQFKALFDPSRAEALYKIMETGGNGNVSAEVLAKFFGKSKDGLGNYLKDLFEVGNITQITSRSAALGAGASSRQEEERKQPLTIDLE